MSLRFPSLLPSLPPPPPRPSLCRTLRRLCHALGLAALALPSSAQSPPAYQAHTNHIVVPQIGACAVDGGGPRIAVTQVVARVRLDDNAAHTTLEVTVQNKTASHEAFELLVPSPRNAQPTGSAGLETAYKLAQGGTVTIQDVLAQGGLPGEQGLAKSALTTLKGDAAVGAMLTLAQLAKTPWPLEFAGHDLLVTQPFELAPSGQVTVFVSYDQPLTWLHDETTYTLPRSEAHESIQTPWGLDLIVEAGPDHRLARVLVPTQDVVVQDQGPRQKRVQFVGGRHAEPGPIHVRVLRANADLAGRALYILEQGAIGAQALGEASKATAPSAPLSLQDVLGTPVDNQGQTPAGAFMLYTGLDPKVDASSAASAREVLFVFDRSGSMRGDKLEQAREAAVTILEGLGEHETFNFMAYSSRVDALFNSAQQATEENRQKARDFIFGLSAEGSTNIDHALSRALANAPTEGHLPLVLFLTDGLPTAGETDERALVDKLASANQHGHRIITFGVGYDVNVGLLDNVASRANGSSHYVRPSENVENKIASVYDGLRSPVLISPTLSAWTKAGQPLPNALRLVQPASLPDVFAGGALTVLGRCTATEPIVLRISGQFLGAPRHFDFELDPTEPAAGRQFIPQLWASRTIAHTVQDIRKPGRMSFPAKLGELLLDLSTRYGIVGEYTAFLSLDETNLWDRAKHRELLLKMMTERAQAIRIGRAAVSQSMNANDGLRQTTLNRLNRFVSGSMNEITIPSVRHVGGRAFFRRGTTWIDSLLLGGEATQAVDQTVALGSPEYVALVRTLANAQLVGMLSLPGSLLLAIDGRCVYVQPN